METHVADAGGWRWRHTNHDRPRGDSGRQGTTARAASRLGTGAREAWGAHQARLPARPVRTGEVHILDPAGAAGQDGATGRPAPSGRPAAPCTPTTAHCSQLEITERLTTYFSRQKWIGAVATCKTDLPLTGNPRRSVVVAEKETSGPWRRLGRGVADSAMRAAGAGTSKLDSVAVVAGSAHARQMWRPGALPPQFSG